MDEQQQQQLIQTGMQILQAAQQGDEQAAQIVQEAQKAKQDENRMKQVAAEAQQGSEEAFMVLAVVFADEVAQQQQVQQAQLAKFGAKLNYIRGLRGKCPTGYEMQFFKRGGKVCKKCMKKEQGGEVPQNKCGGTAVEQFKAHKCGGKAKKVRKHQGGGTPQRKGRVNPIPDENPIKKFEKYLGEGYESGSRMTPEDVMRILQFPQPRDIDPGFQITPDVDINPDPGFTIEVPEVLEFLKPKRKFSHNGLIELLNNQTGKYANGGSFVPFTNRGLK